MSYLRCRNESHSTWNFLHEYLRSPPQIVCLFHGTFQVWAQTTDILQLWFNVELIFQNQGLTLSMLRVKQREYFIKDPNQLIDSLLLKIFFLLKQNMKNKKNNKKNLSIIKAEILD